MNLFIVDTNVVLSALVALHAQSPSLQIVTAILARRLPVLLSPALLAEYSEVLLRKDVARRHRRSPAQVNRFLVDLVTVATMTHPQRSPRFAPDPGDQHLWDLLDAETEAILVTGDRKLLESSGFPGRIISPRECVERYGL